MSQPQILIRTYIASTPDKVWHALTTPDITEKYWYGTRVESDWRIGSKVIYRRQGAITDEHVLLQAEPYKVLRHTFRPTLGEIFRKEAPSKVCFEITDLGPLVRLTLTHDDFAENSAVYRACSESWPMLLSSLKTFLETGRPLPPFAAAV